MENVKKIAVTWGAMLGVLLIVTATLVYAIDLSLFTNTWYGIIAFLIVSGFGIASAIKTKKEMGGFITFKQSFRAFFITILIGFLMYTVFSIVLFNVIDTDAKQVMTEAVIKSSVEMAEKFGAPSAQIDEMVTKLEEQDSFGPVGQFQGFLVNIVIYSIVGLIASLVIKRDRPESL